MFQLGDLVTRKSYDNDIIFKIVAIKEDNYILKGVFAVLLGKWIITIGNENLNPDRYINVRWNPLVQDWVPIEKYNEIIEKSLEHQPKTE